MKFCLYIIIIIFLLTLIKIYDFKYVQGTLKTHQNWAFLARFCFLSEEGRFEYVIDYNENQGDINLLLYYDTEDQWNAVYKSNKTCEERETALNIQQNQIVNLTASKSATTREFSGCEFNQKYVDFTTTPIPVYPIKIPTSKKRNQEIDKKGIVTVKISQTLATISTTFLPYSSTSTSSLSSDTEFFPSTTTFSTESSEISSFSDYLENDGSTTPIMELSTTPETEERPKIVKRSLLASQSHQAVPQNFPHERTITCQNARRFRSSRERWWFIAVSNCKGTKGIDIKYELLMTNGASGDYWHEHFSADEFYILPVLMTFSIAYSFLMLGVTICSLELKQRQLLHTTYKIYVLSCTLQLIGILLLSIVYLRMAVNGLELPKFRRFANMVLGASETSFLLLLLLLAKGFTITRGRLSLKGTVKLTVFMCIYITTYLTIFVYEAVVFDPGEVLYLYESLPGYGLIILRLCAWIMFIYSTVFTLKKYPEKTNFYYPFNLFGTLWFVAGPAFIISANTYIDKWVRESVVCAVLLFIAFGGHLMFLILTMPNVANKNFPYHVRTTQIGIMEVNGNAGTSTIEQFGHHIYEPGIGIREHTVIIPLTRRTEEIFEGMYNQKRFARAEITELPDNESIHHVNRDTEMENVLNWSAAKNIPAIDFPDLAEISTKRDSIGSATSKLTENTAPNGISIRRPSSLTNHLNAENQNFAANLEDFIGHHHVPIDLFTVSQKVDNNNANDVKTYFRR